MAWPLIAFAAVSVVSGIVGGKSKKDAADAEAADIRDQGRLLYEESLRDAALIRKEADVFAQNQSLSYIGSGIVLGGSALITLKDTRAKGEAQARSVEKRGEAQKKLGFSKADRLEKQGRAAFITSILGGAKSALGAFSGGGGGEGAATAATDKGTI